MARHKSLFSSNSFPIIGTIIITLACVVLLSPRIVLGSTVDITDNLSESKLLFQSSPENELHPPTNENEPTSGGAGNARENQNPDVDNALNNNSEGIDSTTELTPDPVRSLLLVSTLDGSLTAVERLTGTIRWISKDEPMIRVPPGGKIDSLPKPPFFLPDPRSGSLYVLGRHGQLKKLPFTIPQLVSMAPCKSTEGLLYTGKKLDMWLSLNPLTGEKYEMKANDDLTCPLASGSGTSGKSKTVLIGKSEYTISMLDGPRKWNVTFHDYSSVDMNPELKKDYDLLHFTTPSTGTILTYDRDSGQLLWQTDLSSPVIALYSIDCTLSSLVSVPFTAVASETLNRIKTPAAARDNSQLSPTLYVGECPYGLYAVPSLVDDTVYTITSSNRYLIEGPNGSNKGRDDSSDNAESADSTVDNGDFLFLGHYEDPELNKVKPPLLIEGDPAAAATAKAIQLNESDRIIFDKPHQQQPPPVIIAPSDNNNPGSTPNLFPPLPHEKSTQTKTKAYRETLEQSSFIVVTTAVITILVTIMFLSGGYVFVHFWLNYKKSPRTPFLSRDHDGIITVGKISFDPNTVLGKGCEGTFVFKGKFEKRDVAVKRILPECFQFADREVDLLKESDEHPNVIRYFCTESDGQFRYIALELCSATLHDWIEGKFVHDNIEPVTLLKEATDGLAYLHSRRIVHRDIKPANVLLSTCSTSGGVKAMISDFGLCKKLMNGRVSFSRRSGGIPGTEGWIAPELMKAAGRGELGDDGLPTRVTHAVDIFSLGCVFYYVLSKGSHPFGDAFSRQNNIILGEHDLSKLTSSNDTVGIRELIKIMISTEAEDRPPPSAILSHPIFWSQEKILGFFLDVSDRIEKETEQACSLLRSLENDDNKSKVVREDWRNHICPEVALDLRKYRTYRGESVRDLLRALRNKKNHYRELTPQAQVSLGEIPNKFVNYWISRFPSLLPYTWSKCEKVKWEPIFSKYYPRTFTFSPQMGKEEFEQLSSNSSSATSDTNNFDNNPPAGDGPPSLFPPSPRQVISKNFWKGRNQHNNSYKYNNNRRRPGNGNGGGAGGGLNSGVAAIPSYNQLHPTMDGKRINNSSSNAPSPASASDNWRTRDDNF